MSLIDLFSGWSRRRGRARSRAQLRVHRAIVHANLDLENHRIAAKLEDAGAPAPGRALKGFVPDDYLAAGECCLRQRCLTMNFSFLLTEAGKHLVDPGAALVMPVPARWREYLRKQGLVLSMRSRFRFLIVTLDSLTTGLRAVRLMLLAQSRGWQVIPPAPEYHAFVGVGAGNLPDRSGAVDRKNLHSWYREFYRLQPDFPFVAENRGVEEPQWYGETGVMVPRQFPPLDDDARRKFRRAAFSLSLRAILGTLCGRWWQAFLLNDVVELAYVRLVPDKYLARRYVFHAGNCLVRPLWTYDAEARGCDVVNAFYSANFITFTPNADIRPARTLALSAMSWPKMICLDDVSRNALIEYGLPSETVAVSDVPIDFLDDGPALPSVTGPVVMLFDVTPYRPYFKATRGFHNAYYTAEMWTRFIDDVIAVAKRNGWRVALKAKRQKDRFNAPAYQRHIDQLSGDPDVLILDAGIAASRALTIADAVISMPFTSPSLMAARQGRPGIFYDPGGKLAHYRSLSRGLPMLTDQSELDTWFQSLGTDASTGASASTSKRTA